MKEKKTPGKEHQGIESNCKRRRRTKRKRKRGGGITEFHKDHLQSLQRGEEGSRNYFRKGTPSKKGTSKKEKGKKSENGGSRDIQLMGNLERERILARSDDERGSH